MQASKFGKKSDSPDEYTGSITGSYVPRADDPGNFIRTAGFGLDKKTAEDFEDAS
ncbi:MAG: hypothetical protein HC802_01615 [Caldilineaceae bacterium]|nr:hypothetical protein [Caldilineaceae bacterium]